MINIRDVIRMKVPFPNISSDLAVQAHMYICRISTHPNYSYIKCQTLKPSMLIKSPMRHYVDEEADSSRNPFTHKTRIDCDKVFSSHNVQYSDSLKTTIRNDVCEQLFSDVEKELLTDGYTDNSINEKNLTKINSLITWI